MLWEDLEEAGGEGRGRGDRDGEDMWTQGLFISMYDKIHYKLKKKKIKDLGAIKKKEKMYINLKVHFIILSYWLPW